MKKGLMLVLALAVTFAGTARADEGTQKLLDKISNLESKVSKLESRSVAPTSAPAPSGGTAGGPWVNNVDGINMGGWVSAGYNYNWSAVAPHSSVDSSFLQVSPSAGTANANGNNTNIRAFDRDANSFIENGEVVLEKAAQGPGTAGFRADILFGRDAQIFNSVTIGDATDNFAVQQAYVQYVAPIGNGIDIKAGRFVAICGSEVLESKDNWNTSRSLLYTLAQPLSHNGVIASYKINDLIDVKLGLANGWDSSIDNNNSKTILSQINIHPMSGLDISQSWIIGSEQTRIGTSSSTATAGNAPDRNLRQFFDTVVAWTPIQGNDRWKLLGNFDVGWEERAVGIEGVSVWEGLALGTKYDVNDWLTLAARMEYFNDNDGSRIGNLNGITGTVGCPNHQTQTSGGTCTQPTADPANLYEMTFTADIKLAKNLITRLEWRYDWATDPIFDLSNGASPDTSLVVDRTTYVGASNSQHTLGAEVIYVFG